MSGPPRKPDRIVGVLPIDGRWRVRYVQGGKTKDHWEETDEAARRWAADKTIELVTAPRSPPVEVTAAPAPATEIRPLDRPLSLEEYERWIGAYTIHVARNPRDDAARAVLAKLTDAVKAISTAARTKKDTRPDEDEIAKYSTDDLVKMAALIAEELQRRERVSFIPDAEEDPT